MIYALMFNADCFFFKCREMLKVHWSVNQQGCLNSDMHSCVGECVHEICVCMRVCLYITKWSGCLQLMSCTLLTLIQTLHVSCDCRQYGLFFESSRLKKHGVHLISRNNNVDVEVRLILRVEHTETHRSRHFQPSVGEQIHHAVKPNCLILLFLFMPGRHCAD